VFSVRLEAVRHFRPTRHLHGTLRLFLMLGIRAMHIARTARKVVLLYYTIEETRNFHCSCNTSKFPSRMMGKIM
jgi:hypothetical protein